MIAAWMLAATAFTLLLGVAALAIERALRHTRYATRLPWTIALVIGFLWPMLAPLVLQTAAAPPPAAVVVAGETSAATAGMISSRMPVLPSLWNARVTPVLLGVWAFASALLLLRILLAARVLARIRHSAQPTVLDGHAVLVTASLGPAVIGFVRPRVAVPAWFTELDRPLRRLVLRHEQEHCRSHDPQLVWLSSVAVALLPWNLALWWLAGRLRLALEIDCDTRTLQQESTPGQYGKLLLLIAQRQSGYPLATMLAESTSHLSRRISAMQTTPFRRPLVRGMLLAGVAAGAIALACSPRIATDLTSPQSTARPALTKTLSNGPVYFEYQVEKPARWAKTFNVVMPKNVPPGKNVLSEVLVQYVVNEQGVIEMPTVKVLKSTHSEFTQPVLDALHTIQFTPATIGGRAVKQLVQQPIEFITSSTASELSAVPSSADTRAKMVPDARNAGILVPNGGTITASSAPTPARAPAAHVPGTAYFEYQVEKPVLGRVGSRGPAYPAEMKAQKVEGGVLAQFIVDEQGMPELGTFKVLKSTNDEFAAAVRDALPNMRFEPALVGGKAVRQVVQQPFQFSLAK